MGLACSTVWSLLSYTDAILLRACTGERGYAVSCKSISIWIRIPLYIEAFAAVVISSLAYYDVLGTIPGVRLASKGQKN